MYDLLEEVRLRPGMWLRRSSLQHLDSMLSGYVVALQIHGIEEPLDLRPGSHGPFAQWLWKRLDMHYPSALGWAVEIERAAEQVDRPAIEMFFDLLDEFRATDRGVKHQVQPDHQATTQAEQPRATD
ncbi:hypothetical protein [Streptomyces antibioticus]|uniref:hypothetical protein n=1 Tax=Streptomyces antibioticus TaxID=1890 RepID=UPI002255A615|nr:hypothetical protein [Streptomyces antibioticus]MCX4738570.1 hypothetical protein [Streptomyces antibioticus]